MQANNFKFMLSRQDKKIALNLANISTSPNDEFSMITASMSYGEFQCELCGQKHCVKEFVVKNNSTGKVMSVGSECIERFKDKGVDIDLAEGLMKRVTSASNKARRDLKQRLGQDAWKALPEEEKKKIVYREQKDFIDNLGVLAYKNMDADEKRELVVAEFLTLQAKELLTGYAAGKAILTEDDVKLIMELGMEDKMTQAQKTHEANRKRLQIQAMNTNLTKFVRESPDFTEERARELALEIEQFSGQPASPWYLDGMISSRHRADAQKAKLIAEYPELMAYTGTNPFVLRTRQNLINNYWVAPADISAAHTYIRVVEVPVEG